MRTATANQMPTMKQQQPTYLPCKKEAHILLQTLTKSVVRTLLQTDKYHGLSPNTSKQLLNNGILPTSTRDKDENENSYFKAYACSAMCIDNYFDCFRKKSARKFERNERTGG